MKTQQVILLTVLVVVIGFGGLWFKQRQNADWRGGTASDAKLLARLPVGEELAQIVIRQGTNELALVKQAEWWSVRERNHFPADYAALSGAILKLRNLKPAQTETVGASQLGRLELLPATATRVEFRDAAGKVLETLTLGKIQTGKSGRPSPMGDDGGGMPVGRWLTVGTATNTALLVSDPLSNLVPQPASWLKKDFLKVEKLKAISVTHPEATNSWAVTRENESASDWKLADAQPGEELDSTKTSGFGWALSSPSFNDVSLSGGVGERPTVIRLETFEGFSYTLKAGVKADDSVPLQITVEGKFARSRTPAADEKAEDKARLDKDFAEQLKKLDEKLAAEKVLEQWTFIVSGWTLDSLNKARGELLKSKTEAAEKKEGDVTTEPVAVPAAP